MVRCKFRCNMTKAQIAYIYDPETKSQRQATVQEATFVAVTDGSPESKKFFAATPSGTLTIGTHEVSTFEAGKYYYVDLTEAAE